MNVALFSTLPTREHYVSHTAMFFKKKHHCKFQHHVRKIQKIKQIKVLSNHWLGCGWLLGSIKDCVDVCVCVFALSSVTQQL